MKGKLWWIAESQQELNKWIKELPPGVELVRADPHPTGQVDMIIELEKETAADVLGYAVEECEWMTE